MSKLNVVKITDEHVEVYLSDEVKNMQMMTNKSSDDKIKRMLALLVMFSIGTKPESNGYCYASNTYIANAIGCSTTDVVAYVKRLKDLGFITKIETGSTQGGRSTRYWLKDDLIRKSEEKVDSNVTVEELLNEIEQYKVKISNLQSNIIRLNQVIEDLMLIKDDLINKVIDYSSTYGEEKVSITP